MGISILELVIGKLREAGFVADWAYPGQKFLPIRECVAAVHILKVERNKLSVTVEVNILCPAAVGGAGCELEALRATEVLRGLGAECVQQGCRYDGAAQVYAVAILAEFTAVTGAEDHTIGPGFAVYLDDVRQKYAVAFTQEERRNRLPEYAAGCSAPAAVLGGESLWEIVLEEVIPAGEPEEAEPAEGFELKLVTQRKTQRFLQCRWDSIRREFTSQGLHRVRKGVASKREELV